MKIFVAMPLGRKEIPALRPTIRKAVEHGGFSCVFPDEIPGHGAIITDVMDAIAESAAVIVDISRSNPNVIWEYGWASAVAKPVFPISNTKESFFFDRRRRLFPYRSTSLIRRSGTAFWLLRPHFSNLRASGAIAWLSQN